jgi:signal transduction histidine kinase
VSYLAILLVVLVVLDAAAYVYLAGARHDVLEPILGTPEGRAVYAAAMRRTALDLALIDVPLLLLSGIAAFALARISVRPLIEAREREARFAAEAAHELRTPLARIAGLAQSPPADALDRIAEIALDASATVGDLLALVREEKVAQRLSEPVDVGAVARTAVAAARHEGVRYEVDAADGAWVLGDERRLRRLAENLVENAGRYARGSVRVAVEAEGLHVALSVEDDGPGVPPALRERIFERFVRERDDGAGSGLGLAICRTIARAHGGDVVLEGESRFVARLPAFALHEDVNEV